LAPYVACGLPTASSRSTTNVVLPPSATPMNGRICQSAAAASLAVSEITAAKTRPTDRPPIPVFRATRLPDEQSQKHARERRHRDVAGREIHRPREARAVREQNQRHAAPRRRQHHRRRSRALAVLPDYRLAVVGLHEPADAVRQRLAVAADWRGPRVRE